MIIEAGEKVHVVYRALYENSHRRHFIGEIIVNEGALCRLQGIAFIYDKKTTMFIRKPETRTTVINLAENGYIVNIIDRNAMIDDIVYKYVPEVGLMATDNKSFSLDINEFGSRN